MVGAHEISDPDVADIVALSDSTTLLARVGAELPVTSGVDSGIAQGPIPTITQEVIDQFGAVFPTEIPAGLPPSQPTDHRIDLVPDAVLPCHCIFRNCPEEEVELRRQLDDHLAHGWIEPAQSAFGPESSLPRNTMAPSACVWITGV